MKDYEFTPIQRHTTERLFKEAQSQLADMLGGHRSDLLVLTIMDLNITDEEKVKALKRLCIVFRS